MHLLCIVSVLYCTCNLCYRITRFVTYYLLLIRDYGDNYPDMSKNVCCMRTRRICPTV